jgi:DNA modification methylase
MIRLINRSAHDTGLDAESVHMSAFSPPYWGLRLYAGEQGVDWPAVDFAPMPGLDPLHIPAMRCDLGLEPTPEAYIGHLILVMREMWRVLREDGTCWVNLGDSYAGSWGNYAPTGTGGQRPKTEEGQRWDRPAYADPAWRPPTSNNGIALKPKDLCQIPARFALAAQADGWWVRSRVPWIKRNGMPGSQKDRPTTSHEYIFVLTKSARYFWDQDAIRKPHTRDWTGSVGENNFKWNGADDKTGINRNGTSQDGFRDATPNPQGRYRRTTDWWFESLDEQIAHLLDLRENGGPMLDETGMIAALQVNTKGYKKAHFATWPPDLVRPMIRAGTSARGVCPECGAPWERVVERTAMQIRTSERGQIKHENGLRTSTSGTMTKPPTSTTTGWAATCPHADLDPIPATVLDPFSGSGTTLMVALEEGRSGIGVDISTDYLGTLAPERLTTQIGLAI